jgi:hypothetical protein
LQLFLTINSLNCLIILFKKEQFEKPSPSTKVLKSYSYLISNDSDADRTEYDVDLLSNTNSKRTKPSTERNLLKDLSNISISSSSSYSSLVSSANKKLREFDVNLKDKNVKLLDKLMNTVDSMKEELSKKEKFLISHSYFITYET